MKNFADNCHTHSASIEIISDMVFSGLDFRLICVKDINAVLKELFVTQAHGEMDKDSCE